MNLQISLNRTNRPAVSRTGAATRHWLLAAAISVICGQAVGESQSLDSNQLIVREGDIVTHARPTIAPRGMGLTSARARWRNGIVPYTLDPALTAAQQAVITDAVEMWNDVSSISLIPASGLPASETADRVRFTVGQGCASWVGRQGGEQLLWVAQFCNAGSIKHEIGHVLGLEHEHTRPDRDQYIRIHWDNIEPDHRHNFDKSDAASVPLDTYDLDSIMHYGAWFFSAHGDATIEPIGVPLESIGQRSRPSAGDLATIDNLYATDLSVTAQTVGQSLHLQVGNLGVQGAHAIELMVAVEPGSVAGFVGEHWQCRTNGESTRAAQEIIRCQLPHLNSGVTTPIELRMVDDVALDDFPVRLTSKTADLNLDNNVSGQWGVDTFVSALPATTVGSLVPNDASIDTGVRRLTASGEPVLAGVVSAGFDATTPADTLTASGGGGGTAPVGLLMLSLLTACRRYCRSER